MKKTKNKIRKTRKRKAIEGSTEDEFSLPSAEAEPSQDFLAEKIEEPHIQERHESSDDSIWSSPDNGDPLDSLSREEAAQELEIQNIIEADQASAPKGMSKGSFLKKAREAKGLSLEAVHEATKIPMDALRAIEEGYTVRTLSSFYLKGFLKIYAQHLDVDPREIIDDYKQEVLPQHIKQEVEVFDIQQWLSQYLTRERKQQFIIVFGIIIALFVMFKIIAFIGHRASLRSVKQQAVGTKLIQKVAIVAKEEAIKRKEEVVLHPKIEPRAVPRVEQQPKFVSVPPVITEQQMQKNVTLTIRPRKDSWLSVKSDGVIVFQTTLKRGAVETWTADENIEISGKNINQLEFELNGKMIGPLGRKDRQAKRVVVTKDGLSVTK